MNNIYIPKENVSDVTAKVNELFFNNKELVSEGDLIASVETSKVDFDIETENDGYILYCYSEGDDCPVNDIIAIIFDSIEELEKYEVENATKKGSEENNSKDHNFLISNSARELISKHNISIEDLDVQLITSKTITNFVHKVQNFENAHFQPNDVVLIGTGGAAEMVIDAIKKDSIQTLNIAGFIDDFSNESSYDDLPIFGGIDVLDALIEKGLKNLVLAYGFIGHLDKRRKVFNRYNEKVNFPNIIDPKSNIESSASLGKGNIVLGNAYIGSKVKLGNINVVNTGALISHETEIEDGNHFTPSSTIAGQVKISSLNTFGMNSSILMKTVIGSNVMIKNNVATTSDVDSNKIVK
jgi:sugar O-acyltransferase (sialic acid O-acetyltransferase NeuD family)